MTSKYPPFERIAVGRLEQLDELLIRDRQTDAMHHDHERIPPGIYTVGRISVSWDETGRRAVRYYTLALVGPAGDYHPTVSASQRVNRVQESTSVAR